MSPRHAPCVTAAHLATVIVLATTSCRPAAPAADARDWPGYGRTLAGDRYAPLAQVDTSNVATLKQVCSYALPEVTAFQTGLIVVNGTMYFTTDTISYAIDAATCAAKWKQVRHSPTPNRLAVNRGFAYLDGRLFRGTSDAHVLAMDTTYGRVLWEKEIDAAGPGVTIPMAPLAANGLVFIGNAGGDEAGVSGHVYAFDARDGRQVWKFDAVPDTGAARATWPADPKFPLSGGAFWSSFTYDAPNGVLYVPAGNPAPDFDVAVRPGDNLYANSVIALDAASGRMLGYNQLVKRDNHDWDVDSPPTLVTTRAGRPIIASANKSGLLSILDRSRLNRRDLHTPNDSLGAVLPVIAEQPTTTRENVDVPLSRDHITHFCPGITGGTEWNGAAFDPARNTIYVGAVDRCANVQLQKVGAPIPAFGKTWFAAANKDLPDSAAKARGWLTAFDAESGTVRWKQPMPHPVLAGVTPTAGGVVFTADMSGMIYALAASDGRILWKLDSGQSIGGGVIAYYAGGRQLLAVASGMKSGVWPGAAQESRILVFGLP